MVYAYKRHKRHTVPPEGWASPEGWAQTANVEGFEPYSVLYYIPKGITVKEHQEAINVSFPGTFALILQPLCIELRSKRAIQ